MSAPWRAVRGKQVIRLIRLMERLKVRRAALGELSREFGVTTRTIRRDMEALSVAGVPVRNTADAAANGFNGFWWIER